MEKFERVVLFIIALCFCFPVLCGSSQQQQQQHQQHQKHYLVAFAGEPRYPPAGNMFDMLPFVILDLLEHCCLSKFEHASQPNAASLTNYDMYLVLGIYIRLYRVASNADDACVLDRVSPLRLISLALALHRLDRCVRVRYWSFGKPLRRVHLGLHPRPKAP